MLERRLEPEVMDTSEDALDYDTMDHSSVNRAFADHFLEFARVIGFEQCLFDQERRLRLLDVGTGTALIPIELCSRQISGHILAIDLAGEMLKLAIRNIVRAGLSDQIQTARIDAKQLPHDDGTFDAVVSNSIVHHIPRPQAVIAEMIRVLRRGGLLFVRDLLRPESQSDIDRIVAAYAGQENAHSQQLFRDSLHAALSLAEIRELFGRQGVPPLAVAQTSDRHWTLAWSKD